jgi:hypothetical protein
MEFRVFGLVRRVSTREKVGVGNGIDPTRIANRRAKNPKKGPQKLGERSPPKFHSREPEFFDGISKSDRFPTVRHRSQPRAESRVTPKIDPKTESGAKPPIRPSARYTLRYAGALLFSARPTSAASGRRQTRSATETFRGFDFDTQPGRGRPSGFAADARGTRQWMVRFRGRKSIGRPSDASVDGGPTVGHPAGGRQPPASTPRHPNRFTLQMPGKREPFPRTPPAGKPRNPRISETVRPRAKMFSSTLIDTSLR